MLLKFFGGSRPGLWWELASLRQFLERVKIWGASTPKLPKWSLLKKVHLGGLTLTPITFLLVDQSSPIFLHIRGGVVVDNTVLRFSLCWSFPQLFALKVESCQKSLRILDVFCPPPQFLLGDPFQNLCPRYHKGVVLRSLIKFCGVTPSSSKVIATLNFKSILNIRFYFFGGSRSRLWCALASLGESLTFVKIWGATTP